jgi:hypothetical protein
VSAVENLALPDFVADNVHLTERAHKMGAAAAAAADEVEVDLARDAKQYSNPAASLNSPPLPPWATAKVFPSPFVSSLALLELDSYTFLRSTLSFLQNLTA